MVAADRLAQAMVATVMAREPEAIILGSGLQDCRLDNRPCHAARPQASSTAARTQSSSSLRVISITGNQPAPLPSAFRRAGTWGSAAHRRCPGCWITRQPWMDGAEDLGERSKVAVPGDRLDLEHLDRRHGAASS
jgi:hypothetical protein